MGYNRHLFVCIYEPTTTSCGFRTPFNAPHAPFLFMLRPLELRIDVDFDP